MGLIPVQNAGRWLAPKMNYTSPGKLLDPADSSVYDVCVIDAIPSRPAGVASHATTGRLQGSPFPVAPREPATMFLVKGALWASPRARGAVGRASRAQASKERSSEMDFVGYCVKCRKQVQVKQGKLEKTAKGRPMVRGTCPHCGTMVTRFLSDKEAKR